ncbi:MAG: hypothetical protein ACTS3R_06300 [Inquilinaceae bacterium]
MPAATSASRRDLLWQARVFAVLLALYYSVHAALTMVRLGPMAPGTADPSHLYAVLIRAASLALGAEGGAVALRYALAVVLHLMIYDTTRRLTNDRKLAFFAGWAPILTYAVGWRLHEAHPHGVLVAVLILASLGLGLRLVSDPGRRTTVALGVVAGLGLIAGGGYPIALVALLVAGLAGRDTRAAFSGRRVALTLAVALAVILVQIGLLAVLGPGGGLAATRPDGTANIDLLTLLGRLVQAILLAVLPFALLYVLIFHKVLNRLAADAPDPAYRLLVRYLVIVAAGLPLAVVVLKLGIFPVPTTRLLGDPVGVLSAVYPLLLPLILYLFWRVRLTGYSGTEWKWLLIVMAVVAVSIVQLRLQLPFLDLG